MIVLVNAPVDVTLTVTVPAISINLSVHWRRSSAYRVRMENDQ